MCRKNVPVKNLGRQKSQPSTGKAFERWTAKLKSKQKGLTHQTPVNSLMKAYYLNYNQRKQTLTTNEKHHTTPTSAPNKSARLPLASWQVPKHTQFLYMPEHQPTGIT